jgi:eukaryotic-like serine/threonine-protein kinase
MLNYDDILAQFPDAVSLAEGGQKVVFRVSHESHGNCVLKIGHYSSQRTLERIRREYDVLNSLDSAYFPKCYEMNLAPGQRFYVIEQWLAGVPLTERIADFQEPSRALPVTVTLVEALSLLWDRNVIHRDVKPANILIGENDRIFVIDLGIARLLDEKSVTPSINGRGPCTPVYGAPEQLQNRKHDINHRCDQFAVGIVMAQLILGGDHPFDPRVVGTGDSIVENILLGNWAHSGIEQSASAHFLPTLERMLAREPHGRYRTPELLKSALELLRKGGTGS